METVCEHSSQRPGVSALEQERQRMQMNLQQATSSPADNVDTVGEIPATNLRAGGGPPMRGVRRYKSTTAQPTGRMGVQRTTSMRGPRPLAPTKSTDAAASLRGNATARANSSRVLLRATSNGGPARRGAPGRTTSATGLQRPHFNRDQIVNTSIMRKNSGEGMQVMGRGPGGTLQRHESEASLGDFSMGEGSLFTMDSVALRKGQMVADPLEEGTYNEEDSFADHESFVTRDSEADFIRSVHAPVLTFGDLENLRLTQRLQISADDSSVVSFGTLASGLTTDYTEHDDSEYACDETEYAE